MELRNAVPKETLRHHLLTSSAEALPKTGSSLLSCFTNAESPKPQLQDRLSATGEALDLCSETALQSWFDPLDITLVQETNTLSVRFPHAFFGIRFASLFQKCFEKKARELWGKGLVVTYGGKTLPVPPPAVPETVPGEERKPDGVHPAVGNELFRTLGSDLYSASLSDLELLYAERSVLAVRQELFAKEAVLIDDFQHLSRIPDKSPTTVSRFRAPLAAEPETPAGPSLREELCLLLDRFTDQGKPVIVAGVGRPKDWNLGKALLSRLETGLWAELPEPDLDVRVRYAQQQAKLRRLPLPREQLLLIAQHCPDIRRLSGVIRRVSSHRSLLGRDLSEQDLLNIVRQGGDGSALTPQLIVSIVGEHCGVPAKEILGEKRRPDLVQARQLAMYLCRELLGHSYPVIGRMFGCKDPSTVMHGVKKIKLLQERDRLVHSMVTELTKTCLEHRG